MVSIKDVAKLAGVSPATVSRVINNTARVDEEKKARVDKAIKEMGYKPNELARALYRKSSHIIGVIVPNIENPFFNELARAVEHEAFLRGYRIMLCNSDDNTEKEKRNIDMLMQLNADGLIIMTNSEETHKRVENCSLPTVALDRVEISGAIANVEADHYTGGRMACAHLYDCGCRKIVCMKGPEMFSSGQKRYRGYSAVCREKGIPECVIESDFTYASGLQAAEDILQTFPDVDGIMASNDMAALALVKALTRKGYRVPEDVQVMGFDNISFCQIFSPELSTVMQPISAMGKRAVEILADNKEGKPFEVDNVFDVQLIPRETTRRKI